MPLEHWGSQVEQHASEVRCRPLQGTTGNTHAKLSPFCGPYDTTKCVEIRAGTSTPWNIGGSQVERRRRENRGTVGGEGWGLGRGCAPSQKIYEFFISKWCDMVHSDENDSDLRCSEVPLKGKNKTLVKILGGRQHRTTPAGQILGVATPATLAALTPMFSAVIRNVRRILVRESMPPCRVREARKILKI